MTIAGSGSKSSRLEVDFGPVVNGSNTYIQVAVPVAGEPMQFFRVRADQ